MYALGLCMVSSNVALKFLMLLYGNMSKFSFSPVILRLLLVKQAYVSVTLQF